jgi:hypothetical protein
MNDIHIRAEVTGPTAGDYDSVACASLEAAFGWIDNLTPGLQHRIVVRQGDFLYVIDTLKPKFDPQYKLLA